MREVVVKEVGPVHVLAVRRTVAGQREVVEAIATLRPSVGDVLSGPPTALVLGFPKEGKLPVEIAFPTQAPVSREGFATKTLPALRMFTITHVGPLEGGPEGETFQDTQRRLSSFLRDRKLLPGDDPERFLYHEGAETHGDRTDRYVTEVQYPDHLPIWLDALEAGTERAAGREAAARVMAGSEDLVSAHDGERTAAWVHGAIARLDREVEGEEDRASILNACAHHYIVQSADVLRQAWKETPDLRTLVRRITDEALLGSRYWIDESGPEPLLLIERRPARAEAYGKATDPAEKRYQACFCPLVRDAIRAGKKVSRTFCHCSGGWYVQEWEVVFGEKPRVDLVETMLEGADSCVFAVQIPEGFL